ncbi:hypothetical protein [Gracilibacillus massiliensis]|uniref:hypothetical protein n=1 Tax=Gracilibacillus massiliensis TaxID=1564956 RepID=UPI001CA37749|nr:hypothetical protein [Gracilibacillus massiliensis]
MHFIDGILNYQRGKTTGIYGLVGFVLVLVIAFNFEFVWNFLGTLGIIDMFYKIDVFREGDLFYVAAGRFLLFVLGLLLICVVGILLFMVLFFVVSYASPFLLGVIIIVFFPVAFLLILMYGAYEYCVDAYKKYKDPQGYVEEKRKNKRLKDINKLRFGLDYYKEEKERKKYLRKKGEEAYEVWHIDEYRKRNDTLISMEQAYQNIRKLPSTEDSNFVLGVSYDREFYILLPSPIDVFNNSKLKNGEVYCELIKLNMKYNSKIKLNEWDISIPTQSNNKFQTIRLDEIEMFFDVNKSPLFKSAFKKYASNPDHYGRFAEESYKSHFLSKSILKERLKKAKDEEEYKETQNQLENHFLPNEDRINAILTGKE